MFDSSLYFPGLYEKYAKNAEKICVFMDFQESETGATFRDFSDWINISLKRTRKDI